MAKPLRLTKGLMGKISSCQDMKLLLTLRDAVQEQYNKLFDEQAKERALRSSGPSESDWGDENRSRSIMAGNNDGFGDLRG